MKKVSSGFTLVELLAVIVVLGIIALIGYTSVGKVIEDVKSSKDILNVQNLNKVVNNYIYMQELNGNSINKDNFLIIDDNIEYTLSYEGNKIVKKQSNNLDYSGRICEYCIIKIDEDNNVYILSENAKQNIVKDYSSSNVTSSNIEETREISSLYNELMMLKDVIVYNDPDIKGKFDVKNGILKNESSKDVYKLSTPVSDDTIASIEILDQATIKIVAGDKVIVSDDKGKQNVTDNVNSTYNNEILSMYEEIKYAANKYISTNDITDEEYFEIENGKITKKDLYGNNVTSNITLSNVTLSGEVKINSSKQVSIVMYSDNSNIISDYGSDKLYTKDLPYSRDMALLFKNLNRLQSLGIKYLGSDTYSKYSISNSKISDSEWLVFFYIRRLKYNSSNYNNVTGNDSTFVTYVSTNGAYLKNYFTNKNTFEINDETVDLKHMAASIAGNMYNTPSLINALSYEEAEFDCLVSWAGDLHEFMEYNILKSGVKEKYGSYKEAVYSLMGDSSTRFGMDDVYADIDNWNLYYNFIGDKKNLAVGDMLEQYYTGVSARNYKNRYTSFIKLMDNVAKGLKLSNSSFSTLVKHFTDTDKNWETIGSLSITPTETEQNEIAEGFINWINEKASLEK